MSRCTHLFGIFKFLLTSTVSPLCFHVTTRSPKSSVTAQNVAPLFQVHIRTEILSASCHFVCDLKVQDLAASGRSAVKKVVKFLFPLLSLFSEIIMTHKPHTQFFSSGQTTHKSESPAKTILLVSATSVCWLVSAWHDVKSKEEILRKQFCHHLQCHHRTSSPHHLFIALLVGFAFTRCSKRLHTRRNKSSEHRAEGLTNAPTWRVSRMCKDRPRKVILCLSIRRSHRKSDS